MASRLRLALGLLAALALGLGVGWLLARAAPGGAGGLRDAGYDRGYHHGWRDGYDQGYAAGDGPPSTPDHALTVDEARDTSAPARLGDALTVARACHASGHYQAGAYDCNDMAEELWSACSQAGVPSFLVVGNTTLDDESFAGCDHCWVVVFCVDEFTGQEVTLAIDPGAQKLGAVADPAPGGSADGGAAAPGAVPAGPGALPPVSAQYTEGFFYPDPSGLRQDLGSRW